MWNLANPQQGRHPVIVINGVEPPQGGRVFQAARGVQACFAAFNHGWLNGPAALVMANGLRHVPPPLAGMLERIAAGCGAGFGGSEGFDVPVWLPSHYRQAKTDVTDVLRVQNGLFWRCFGTAAPLGCIGTHPALRPGAVTLLVGDRAAGHPAHAQARPDWPFISLLATGCADWLARAVRSESDLCWVNAYSAEGKPKSIAHLAGLPWRQVIAFGNNAGSACEAAGLEAVRIHHPMHWFRNYKDKPYKLHSLLENAHD
jgi:hypothetical protein